MLAQVPAVRASAVRALIDTLLQGIVIGSGVFPIYCLLTWNKVSAIAAISGARPHPTPGL
jgi:hypothetical protein